jgi:integrase
MSAPASISRLARSRSCWRPHPGNRHDATMILMAYRRGFCAAELRDLRWDLVDFRGAVLHARRVKNGTTRMHPIQGDELRALRRLQRESKASPFVFVSERGALCTRSTLCANALANGQGGRARSRHIPLC